jgi:hypothetical protein
MTDAQHRLDIGGAGGEVGADEGDLAQAHG